MSNDRGEATTCAPAGASWASRDPGREKSYRFRRLAAQDIVARLVEDPSAHFLGVTLARLTPSTGELLISQPALTRILRLSDTTLRKATKILSSAGLLAVTRRRDGILYKWTALAYPSHLVAPGRENGSSPAFSPEGSGAAHLLPLVLDHYLAVREAVHKIPRSLPYRGPRLTEDQCAAIEEAFECLVGELGRDLAWVAPASLEYWMSRRAGTKSPAWPRGFLVENAHPLDRLPADLPWLVGEMLATRGRRPEIVRREQLEIRPATAAELKEVRGLLGARAA